MTQASFVNSIAEYYAPTLRGRLRHVAVAGAALAQRVSGRQAEGLGRGRVHFVMLHSVFPDEETGFRALIRRLAVDHELIGYSEAVRRVLTGATSRPAVTFSFDDGMRNNLAAARILDEFGAKACFFVCSDIVGERDHGRLARFCRERLRSPAVEFLDWNEVELLLRWGHEIGSHTRSHAHLADLEAARLDEELGGSRDALKQRIGEIRHLAWPYGRFDNIPAGFAGAVIRNGYQSCASGARGCHVVGAPVADQLCIRRDHVIAGWPVGHSLYFMARSALRASATDNDWPAGFAAAPLGTAMGHPT